MRIYGHRTGSILELERRLADCNVSLRWGGPQVAGAINGQVQLLDGLQQLQILQTKGIIVPTFSTQSAVCEQLEGLWLARKRNHTQGKDIIPCTLRGVQRVKGRRNWRDSDFFIKYIPAVREWRFHILNGQSIARGLKVIVDNYPHAQAVAEFTHPIIRSRRLGWHMEHTTVPSKVVRAAAKAAVAAVGYDLGAVDLLELADGSACVLEVNSRPAIRDEYTLTAYEQAFRRL